MKNTKETAQEFQAKWEHAIERAVMEQVTDNPLGELLEQVVGVRVASGVRAGGWTSRTACQNNGSNCCMGL